MRFVVSSQLSPDHLPTCPFAGAVDPGPSGPGDDPRSGLPSGLTPEVALIVEGCLLAPAAAGPAADLVTGFARPVATRAVAALLGVPYPDLDFIERRCQVLARGDASAAAIREATADLRHYLADLITAEQFVPGDQHSVISRLVAEQADRGDFSAGELQETGLRVLTAGARFVEVAIVRRSLGLRVEHCRHRCIGERLTRTVLELALPSLLHRFPAAR